MAFGERVREEKREKGDLKKKKRLQDGSIGEEKVRQMESKIF